MMDVQTVVLSICPLPLKWIKCQVLTKMHRSFVFGQVTVLIDGHDGNK